MTTWGLACAILAGLLNCVLPHVFRAQGTEPGRQMGLQLCGAALSAAAAAAVLALTVAPGVWLRLWSGSFLGLSAAAGIAFTFSNLAYFSVVTHRGPLSISWAVIWTNAVLVAALGWLLLRERVLAGQPFAILCLLGCLAAMGLASHRTAKKRGAALAPRPGFWPWLLAALALATAGNLCMKLLPSPGDAIAPVLARNLSFAFVRCALTVLVLVVYFGLARARPVLDRRTLRLSALYALVFLPNMLLFVEGLRVSPISLFFPVAAGVAILAGTVLALARGERPSRLTYAGAALAIASIALIHLGPELGAP